MRLLVVLDCIDADALAGFWSSALGFRRGSFHPPYVRWADPKERWPNLLLQQVPEPKSGKNRMHLDIQVADVHAEVERLTALGASVVEPPHADAGFLTAILADPQHNEFCVIQPPQVATTSSGSLLKKLHSAKVRQTTSRRHPLLPLRALARSLPCAGRHFRAIRL